MTFEDRDIQFEKLEWKDFEELCFDLLLKYHFHSLNWRQGGADKGRDIQAIFTVANGMIGAYQERWFVECKHYKKGVPQSEISSKVEWAEAEKADHLLILTSSYLTASASEYLEKKRENLSFGIHLIDGKNLKQRLLPFPDLIVKYFADDTTKLVRDLLKQWIYHDYIPEKGMLVKLEKNINPAKLNIEELVFLLFSFESCDFDDVTDEFHEDVVVNYDFLYSYIIASKNSEFPINNIDSSMYTFDMLNSGGTCQSYIKQLEQLRWHHVHIREDGTIINVYLEKSRHTLTSRASYRNPVK
ncbi:restriction endonuclease [Pedobacter sp. Du54]|uniref:restriction endonuclease n=1 Tax=Pedobacter anseongensis TaxID=3133439 RepID=UPI0030AA5936